MGGADDGVKATRWRPPNDGIILRIQCGFPTALAAMSEVTHILSPIEGGDPDTAERLLPARLSAADESSHPPLSNSETWRQRSVPLSGRREKKRQHSDSRGHFLRASVTSTSHRAMSPVTARLRAPLCPIERHPKPPSPPLGEAPRRRARGAVRKWRWAGNGGLWSVR